jgi:hypothetical protein
MYQTSLIFPFSLLVHVETLAAPINQVLDKENSNQNSNQIPKEDQGVRPLIATTLFILSLGKCFDPLMKDA